MCVRATAVNPTSVIFGDLRKCIREHSPSQRMEILEILQNLLLISGGENMCNKNKERKDPQQKIVLRFFSDNQIQDGSQQFKCRHYLINMTSFSQSRISTDQVTSVWRQNYMATRNLSFLEVVKACVSKDLIFLRVKSRHFSSAIAIDKILPLAKTLKILKR